MLSLIFLPKNLLGKIRKMLALIIGDFDAG